MQLATRASQVTLRARGALPVPAGGARPAARAVASRHLVAGRRRRAPPPPPTSLPATATASARAAAEEDEREQRQQQPPFPQGSSSLPHLPPPSDVTAPAVPLPLDYYRALGVARGAAREAIRRAYDRAAAAAGPAPPPSSDFAGAGASAPDGRRPQDYYAGEASGPPCLPRGLFSQDALFARAALLRQALDTLTDPDARREYDGRAAPARRSPTPPAASSAAAATAAAAYRASAVGPVVFTVDVSAADVPGALVLMQEAGGQAASVAALGEAWLRLHGAAFPAEAADVAAAVALARCDLAAALLDAAEAAAGTNAGELRGGQALRVRPACEQLEAALALLRRAGRGPQLQQQIAQALDDYAPSLSLELLALPLALPLPLPADAAAAADPVVVGSDGESGGGRSFAPGFSSAASAAESAVATNHANAQLRARGLELARRALWDPWAAPALQPDAGGGGGGGEGGDGDGFRGGGGGRGPGAPAGDAREAYVAALRDVTTAREQIALFSGLPSGARVPAGEMLDTALAHAAEGFATRQPRLVARAAAAYEALARAAGPALDVSVERAACALLLGDPTAAERLLGFGGGGARGGGGGAAAAAAAADAAAAAAVDPEVRAFVLAQSGVAVPAQGSPEALSEAAAQAPEGLLPGLCALTEAWLQDAVLPRFRPDPAAEELAAAAAAQARAAAASSAAEGDEAPDGSSPARPASPLDAWFEAPWVRTYARVTYATRGVLQGGPARALASAVAAAVAFVRAALSWLWRLVSSPFGSGGGGNRGPVASAAAAPPAAQWLQEQQFQLQPHQAVEQAAEAELHSSWDAYGGGGAPPPATPPAPDAAFAPAYAPAAAAPALAPPPPPAAPTMTEEEEDALLLEFDRRALESESLTVEELRARLSRRAEDDEQQQQPQDEAPARPAPRPRPTARPTPAPSAAPGALDVDVLRLPPRGQPAVWQQEEPGHDAEDADDDDDLEQSPFTGAAFRGKREAAAASLRALELDMWESRRDERSPPGWWGGGAGGWAEALPRALLAAGVAAAAAAGALALGRSARAPGAASGAPAGEAAVAVVAPAAAAPAAVAAAPAAAPSSVPAAAAAAAASAAAASAAAASEAPLSRRAAHKVISAWLDAKGKALGGGGGGGGAGGGAGADGSGAPTGADACLDGALTGKMLQKWRSLAREASAAGWYWRYRVRSVSVSEVLAAPGGGATVVAAIEEAGEVRRAGGASSSPGGGAPSWTRFWRRGGGEAQPADSYDARYTMRYTLAPAADGSGGWRIADSAMVGEMVRV